MYKPKGFTLIELIIVIAIISVLVLIVVVAIDPAAILQRSNDAKARAELGQVKTALQLYFNEVNDYPPSGDLSPLTPNYINSIPSTVEPGNYTKVSQTDYLATTAINKVTAEDNESAAKCGQSSQSEGGSGVHYICPE